MHNKADETLEPTAGSVPSISRVIVAWWRRWRCALAGHRWEMMGGRECSRGSMQCSEPVMQCVRCGKYDFADESGAVALNCEDCSDWAR